MRKSISILILAALLVGVLAGCQTGGGEQAQAPGGEGTGTEGTLPKETLPKKYGNYKLEDPFEDNTVVVILMPEYNFTEYTVADFADIGCTEVRDLFSFVEADRLSRALVLTLSEHSKQNVLDAIELLYQRPDVYEASPNLYMTMD